MKHLFIIVRGNMRRNKGAYIGIMILMLVVSLSFVTIYNVTYDSRRRQTECLEKNGYGDYWAALNQDNLLKLDGKSAEEIIADVKACNVVGTVKDTRAYTTNLKINEQYTDWCFLVDYDNEMIDLSQYDENNNLLEDKELGENEISLPVTFRSLYGIHVGDKVSIVEKDKKEHEFVVASFLEDPFMGSNIIGIKTALIGKDSHRLLDKIAQECIDRGDGAYYVFSCALLNIFKADTKMSDSEFERSLNRETGFAGFANISLSTEQSKQYSLMLSDIVSAIATVFIIILLIASFIVMGHSINSSIELDYVNLGIYKALGVTGMAIRMAFAISYSIVAVIGLLLGIPVSIPLISFMNGIMREQIGMYSEAEVSLVMGFSMTFITVAVIILFVVIKSRRIAKISPVAAINDAGKAANKRLKLRTRISPRLLNISLALRQVTTNVQKYISVIVVAAMLSFFMVIINNVFVWISDDKALIDMFDNFDYDVYMVYKEDSFEEIDTIIREYSDYEQFDVSQKYFLLNDVQMNCTMISNPKKIKSVKAGNTCLKNNEILITDYISEEFGLEIGDTAKVTIAGQSKNMVVSGICDLSNDMGKAFVMSKSARATFKVGEYAEGYDEANGNVEDPTYGYYISLAEPDMIDEISKALHERFGEELGKETGLVVFEAKMDEMDGNDVMGGIATGIRAMTVIVFVLGALFISITINLVAGKIMNNEKKDYGIYKAVGIPSNKLIGQMSIKFMLVGIIGAIIGMLIGVIFMKPILHNVFIMFGISNYAADVNASDIIIPVVFMAIVSFVCARISSRKIKKVEPRILIVE